MKPAVLLKNTIVLACLALFAAMPAVAQDAPVVVKGLIKDAESGEKISFASISVPNTSIGTVSNSDGEFILKVDLSLGAEYFLVSHLGYETATFRLADGAGEERTYYMRFKPVLLDEVPIVPDDARSMVEAAFRNIRNNYPGVPNSMTGFYRETVQQRRDYISVTEAVVDIFKAAYTGTQSDQVKIYRGRKASNLRKADTLAVKIQGGPAVPLLLDVARNYDLAIAMDRLENYNFEYGPLVTVDDRLARVISFTPQLVLDDPLFIGKLFISPDSYAIVRAEFSLDLRDKDKASRFFVQKKPSGLVFEPLSTGYLVTYKEEQGIYCLNYVRIDLGFRLDWRKRLFRNNYRVVAELAVTGRSEENTEKFAGSEIFRTTMILEEKVADFTDPDFWGEHNIIDPEESIEDAMRKLTKRSLNKY